MGFQTCFGAGEGRTTTWQQESSPMVRSHEKSKKRFKICMSRIKFEISGMRIERYSEEIARYRMIKHKPEKPNKMRWSLLKNSKKRFGNNLSLSKMDLSSFTKIHQKFIIIE